MTTYEIRTRRGAPVYSYDDLALALKGLKECEARLGVQLCLFKITRIEEEITHAHT